MADVLKKGLPANTDAEKFLLGAILRAPEQFAEVGKTLEAADFSFDNHRRIFKSMLEMQARGDVIDRITLADELQRVGDLGSVGIGYLTDLDTGLPDRLNIRPYVGIVKEHSRRRQVIFAAQRIMNEAVQAEAFSDDLIQKAQQALLSISSSGDRQGQFIDEFIADFPGGLNRLLQPWTGEKGIRTGFVRLDEWTDGFHEAEIFVIGARPGTGKSAIGLNICDYVAKRGYATAIFSLEMSKKSCVNRLICANARVDSQKFRLGFLNDEEKTRLLRAATLVNALPIFIDDTSGVTVADISMRLQALMQKRPVGLCLIDYFQLMRPLKGQRHATENDMYTHIAHDLQMVAKRTGVPLLILSQLNRESEKGVGGTRPRLSQCRGAGAIEEICNVGGVLYREEMQKRDREDLRGVASLIVEKNRSGPAGEIELVYLAALTKFENRAEDISDEQIAAEPSDAPAEPEAPPATEEIDFNA